MLDEGLSVLGIDADAAVRDALLAHLHLLRQWNRAYNLTAVDDPRRAVAVHLLDSLAVWPWLHGRRAIDVGTGAGFPGLPLALLRPDIEFVLLDSRGKKIRFVDTAVRAIGASNVVTAQARVERYRAEDKFDTLLARAFSSLASLHEGGRHLLAPGGRILALKGSYPQREIDELNDAARVRCEVARLEVPFLDAARHLAIIESVD